MEKPAEHIFKDEHTMVEIHVTTVNFSSEGSKSELDNKSGLFSTEQNGDSRSNEELEDEKIFKILIRPRANIDVFVRNKLLKRAKSNSKKDKVSEWLFHSVTNSNKY